MFSLKARWAIASGIAVIVFTGAVVCATLEKEVIIREKDKTVEVSTFAKTVKELLANENIVLEPEDVVMPSLDTKLTEGMQITIKRAFPVKIAVDGKEVTVKTQPNAVVNLLAKAEISLNEKDKVQPSLCEFVSESGEITITRVEQRVTTEVKTIPFEVVSRKDFNLPLGEKKVIQEGEEGQEEVKTIEVIEDGKVVSTSTQSNVLKAPKPQIVLTGTVQLASRGGVDFSYTEKRRMLATAYTHTGNRTATGTTPRVGVAAVDPKVIPLGTRVYVDGYGFARAEDTGGAIKGEKIDLFFNTSEETKRFGRRWVTVYVLK
ncbi:3D domain-containing protein [Tepidanaerobacter acetatoxydans Re1]|uniref:3D domain-containing protein n=1 Tax=Tepidanaerobacter acetatoxydans (strain DSM 21804 / JCM 16047 / Re1) TaxID=1209989 RepID=F4LRP9_TEPAE|nr:ubiquitin-like domain-containing protein [Tepidanaerobacter acetatoxydans]AEE91117.1 3D domain-containing protein [Tepidanaerobacter acetatoxydans Re1]CCP25780.1 3D domain-containing protein [Tepidanaerobacter acetatoxydans Re1]